MKGIRIVEILVCIILSTFNFAINGRYLASQQYQACVRRSAGACSIRYAPCAPRSFRIGPGGGGGVQTYGAVCISLSTLNFTMNGRYLASQQYQACVRRSAGACSIRYAPCAPRSFRIGPGGGVQTYGAAFPSAPGSLGGAGGGFYGPEGAFTMVPLATAAPLATAGMDQQAADNDPMVEEGMMPVMDEVQEDDMEGSGADPQIASMDAPVTPVPSMASRIWSFIWPSWLWGQSSREFSTPKTWGFWSPYAQHYLREDDDFRYQGYGNFGLDLRGFGRQHCQDRITIPCDNEYFVSNSSLMNGVCDPHHCGQTFCPGAPFDRCYVQSSVSPFAVSVNFGPPVVQRSAEENIGACLMYQQLPCDV
ncbi:hypothetical protein JYU34_001394 [Plutella xylostella]|uniref:CUB domain-containing protein n=1 Tax=Plutella xylostella TaxID=51655 RepID=A0ABQ7R3W7_PLUXY|nr:hypothetical protein JYU34_001394 [Plutella xylostella]